MRLSVVIATRRRPAMLAQCLESVAAQSLPAAETIVVDDCPGGDAATAEVCGKYPVAVRLLRSEGGGIAVANNVGLERVTGEAVVPQGDDDLMLPDRLADHARVLTAGASVACGGWINVAAPGRIDLVSGHPRPTLQALLAGGATVAQGAAAYRSEMLRRHRYDERLSMGCDMDLNARLLAAGESFRHSGTFTLLRRLHAGSMTAQHADVQRSVKDGLRARYGIDGTQAPPAGPFPDEAGITVPWEALRRGLPRLGVAPEQVRFGFPAKTLEEVGSLVRALGSVLPSDNPVELTPVARGRLDATLVGPRRPEAIAELPFRQAMAGVVEAETPMAESADPDGLARSLALEETGTRLAVRLDGLEAEQVAGLVEPLSAISPGWRLLSGHRLLDAAFEEPVRLAALSGRFGDADRAGQALLSAAAALAASLGLDQAGSLGRLRGLRRDEDRFLVVAGET